MSSVNTIASANAVEWIKKNQEQVTTHVAWHPTVSESESEKMLKGKSPFTYLIRGGDKEHLYYISFVQEDGSLKHQWFVLEFDRNGWVYRNAGTKGPNGLVSKELHTLIPQILHCDLLACKPLMKN